MITAAAMNYGGRIIEIDHASGKIRHIAEPARHILNDLKSNLGVADSPSSTICAASRIAWQTSRLNSPKARHRRWRKNFISPRLRLSLGKILC